MDSHSEPDIPIQVAAFNPRRLALFGEFLWVGICYGICPEGSQHTLGSSAQGL